MRLVALSLLLMVGACSNEPSTLRGCLLQASQRADARAMEVASQLCRESFSTGEVSAVPVDTARPASPMDPAPRGASGAVRGASVAQGGVPTSTDREPGRPPERPGPEAAPRAGYLGPSCELATFHGTCGATRVDGGSRGFVLLERCLCVVDMRVGWDCIGLDRLDVSRYHARQEVCMAAAER